MQSLTRKLITTVKRSKVDVKTITNNVYESVVKDMATTTKPLDRRLIVEVIEQEISEAKMQEIQSAVDENVNINMDYLIT